MKSFFFLLAFVALTSCNPNSNWELKSAQNNLKLNIELDRNSADTPLRFSLERDGRILVENVSLGLDIPELETSEGFRAIDVREDAKRDKWERIWGRSREVHTQYHELEIILENDQEKQLGFVFRAYNNGIAFRYFIPEQEGLSQLSIVRENTRFSFARDPEVWATTYGGSYSHQENEFVRMNLSEMGPSHLPLLVKATDQDWLALSEARLVDWAGFHLEPDTTQTLTFKIVLEPRVDDPGIAVKTTAGAASPWRFLMVEDSPGKFLASNLVQDLNDPCALEDVSWITPGKSAWDWWWCNSYAPEAGFPLGSDNRTMKYFIDFAAEMGWEYQLVDWQWYGEPFAPTEEFRNHPNPDVDITRSTDKIDIPELVEYARSKGVRILLWLEWNHADRQMEEAFPLYEEWGVAGVKVDFMAREDQEMVQFYERLVKLAAQHHLVVDFHGAYKPTGLSRTWPNLMTREGVLGNEYTKWSDRITPEHTVTLAFTRNILGEMDFTPGAWVNVIPGEFRTESAGQTPVVMATRCNQLAMMVVFESALQVLCDSPHNYRNKPGGLDFLQLVPTTWEETRVLNEEIGNYITVARRWGEDWYVGSMTDGDPRQLSVNLDFLGEGKYSATLWKDGANAADDPSELEKEVVEVDASSTLELALAPGGGAALYIEKIR